MDKIQKISVTAFILKENTALIVKRSPDDAFLPSYWELPGGKVEFGESLEEALIREIMEETNLNVQPIAPYSSFSYLNKDQNKHTIDIQFKCECLSDISEIKLSSEHVDYRLINRDEIDNYQFSSEMKNVIIKGFDS